MVTTKCLLGESGTIIEASSTNGSIGELSEKKNSYMLMTVWNYRGIGLVHRNTWMRSCQVLQQTPCRFRLLRRNTLRASGFSVAFSRRNTERSNSWSQESKILEVLRHRKVFPISMPPETVFRRVSASDVKSIWFVPDDPALSQKFRGRAPMLALPPRKVKSVLKLLQEMQLESRLLSKAVKHEFAPRGSPYIHKEYTNRLSSKAGLIKR